LVAILGYRVSDQQQLKVFVYLESTTTAMMEK
jgi:hypothetical protein